MDFVVCVEFKVKSEQASDFLPIILENAQSSLEIEEGCKQVDVCVSPNYHAEIFLYEIYTSREAFEFHLASEHFLLFNSKTTDMITHKEVRTYIRKT